MADTNKSAPAGPPIKNEKIGNRHRYRKESSGILTVQTPELDDHLRRLALRAMDHGSTCAEMDATLRCLINHCEAYRTGLQVRTPRDTVTA